MGNKFKDIDTKNCTYYFFDDMIHTKNLDPNKINIDEKSYKNILISYIGYVTVEDVSYAKINSVNPLYLIINKKIGTLKNASEIKYLSLVPTNESKYILETYAEL